MSKQKGTAQLPDGTEQRRLEAIELEIKARYWKAQYDIRYYTLEAEKIQPAYDEWLKNQREKQEKAQQELQENIKKLQENGAAITEDGQPIPEGAEIIDIQKG